MINRYILIPILTVLLVSCGIRQEYFTLEGYIANAENKQLYLQYNGLLKDSIIDSVRLDKQGYFRFKTSHPTYPDFYKLRVDKQFILLAIDSTETVKIEANADSLMMATIEASPQSTEIQKYRQSVVILKRQYDKMNSTKEKDERTKVQNVLLQNLEQYTTKTKENILKNPLSLSAYFAIYQQMDSLFIFSPNVADDRPYFAAVGTAFNNAYPDYNRSRHLYKEVILAMQSVHTQQQRKAWRTKQLDGEIGYIDIELRDNRGIPRKISSYIGKPIIVDFTIFAQKYSPKYILALRELYKKYKKKGLVIYQISLDDDTSLWYNATGNLPWICVNDPRGIAGSTQKYNITEMPTLFFIDSQGNIVGRYENLNALDKALTTRL